MLVPARDEETVQGLQFRGRMPGLDILRGLAIAGVMIYHGFDGHAPFVNFSGITRWLVYSSSWGVYGVMLFFVLSGFLISGILLDNPTRPDYYTRFYFNRACRILPAYVVMLAVVKLLHVISWKYLLACSLFIANMATLVGGDVTEYSGFWSLAVEEQFYLIWPIALRNFTYRCLSRFIFAYIAIAPAVRTFFLRYHPHIDMRYKLWGQADFLLAGALISLSLRSGALCKGNINKWIYSLVATGLILLPSRVYLDIAWPGWNTWSTLLTALDNYITLSIFSALVLIVVLRNNGEARHGPIASACVFLGYISYGLYLVHPLIYAETYRFTAKTWLATDQSNVFALLTVNLIWMTVAIVVAYLSRRYFEEYFLRVKDRRARMKTRPPINEAIDNHKRT